MAVQRCHIAARRHRTTPTGRTGGPAVAPATPLGELAGNVEIPGFFEQDHRKVRALSRDPAEGSRNADRRMGILDTRTRRERPPWEPCEINKEHDFVHSSAIPCAG